MAQGRMLSKKISFDEKVAGLSLEATLLYTWCIPHLDCEGRIYAGAEILKGSVVPFIKELTIQKIAKCVEELAQSGLVLHYGNGHKYLQFNGFENNQNIRKDREAPSVIPSPEQVGSNSGVNPGQIKVNQIKLNKSNMFSFEEIYLKYPNRVGKKEALKHFEATVKTEKDFLDIKTALENYLICDRVKKGFIQNASTWFNQWRDWIGEPKKEYLPPDQNCKACKGIGKVQTGEGQLIRCKCVKEKSPEEKQ